MPPKFKFAREEIVQAAFPKEDLRKRNLNNRSEKFLSGMGLKRWNGANLNILCAGGILFPSMII